VLLACSKPTEISYSAETDTARKIATRVRRGGGTKHLHNPARYFEKKWNIRNINTKIIILNTVPAMFQCREPNSLVI
jgi:hypothetical protein